MWQLVRFLVVLIVVLGAIAWGTFRIVTQTTQAWFEKDITLRAQLAVKGAGYELVTKWKDGDKPVGAVLSEITHDERILAAAACDADSRMVAKTVDFPLAFTCSDLARQVHDHAHVSSKEWHPWGARQSLPGGDVYVSAIPLMDNETPIGFIVLVHDLTFVERREDTAQTIILIAFAVLALTACLATLIASRLFWRRWTEQVRMFLRGEVRRREFLPILGDLRAMSERISAERWSDAETGAWTPQRLKETLGRYLEGERVVVLANREPYIHQYDENRNIRVMHPASGLVTAIEPVMEACSGVWIAHGSGSADRDTVDSKDHVMVPPGKESYALRRIWLTTEEEKGYYYGFANEGLWPLCHLVHTRPAFRIEDWKYYEIVNERFAEAVVSEVDADDPIVLIQDYHFALAPAMIRRRLPRATVITFLHVPWPNAEQFGICPWREELIQGLLGSSILGFHTRLHCNNFLEAVDRFLETRIDREQVAVIQQNRSTLIREYPISIEWPNRWAKSAPSGEECRSSIVSELNLPQDVLLGVGVDRLDYTKGIEERIWAVRRLLERYPEYHGRFVFVQLAAPSRTLIDRYRQLNEDVEQAAARVNEQFGAGTYKPVILLRAHHEPPTVFKFYRAANLCYVSSLHDGMNLVAKEFVAARDDEQGVLLLSQFAGASRELAEALIVNPYDLEGASSALAAALSMSREKQKARMRAMRNLIAEFNVYRWAGKMLIDAARLRRSERLIDRLSHRLNQPGTV